MKKNIFDENDKYTHEAIAFSCDIATAMKKVMREWVAKGYSLRELAEIAHEDLVSVTCELAMDQPYE